MNCPTCKEKMSCVDTVGTGQVVYRKYKCSLCGNKFYTTERMDELAHYRLSGLRTKRRKELQKEKIL